MKAITVCRKVTFYILAFGDRLVSGKYSKRPSPPQTVSVHRRHCCNDWVEPGRFYCLIIATAVDYVELALARRGSR